MEELLRMVGKVAATARLPPMKESTLPVVVQSGDSSSLPSTTGM